jgi:hypothetical protein
MPLGNQLRSDDEVRFATAMASISAFRARADPNMSDDRTASRASGKSACASSASLSTPGPTAASRSSASQDGHIDGTGLVSPHWWHTSRLRNRCSTMRESQWSQPICWPQARQIVTGAYPRRLMNNSACSWFSRRCATARCKVGEIQLEPGSCSLRMSIARISGRTDAPNRD